MNKLALLAVLACGLSACNHPSDCRVVSVFDGDGFALTARGTCSEPLSYRWVKPDGTFGAPGADGRILTAPVPFNVAPNNGSHFDWRLGTGDWQRGKSE